VASRTAVAPVCAHRALFHRIRYGVLVSRHRVLVVLSLLGLLAVAALSYRWFAPSGGQREIAKTGQAESAPNRAASDGAPSQGRAGRGSGNTGVSRGTGPRGAPVPVVTATAVSEPFRIRRRTIGILESPATVVIRSRLDSQVREQNARAGQLVKKGDLLFTLDDREVRATLARAQAQLAKDQAQRTRTELDLKRAEELLQRNAAPRTQLENATAENRAAIATVQADEAAVQTEELRLTYTKLIAPIDGRLGAVRVTPGNLVSANDTNGLVTLTQMLPLRVNFTLPERDLTALRRAADRKTPTAVRVYAAGTDTALATGVLDFVDASVDASSGTIAARASFENADMALWPGQFVDVEIDLDVRPDTVMVPAVAIQSGQQGPFLFVAKGSNAEMRKVEIVGAEGNRSALAQGASAGEAVIVEGQFRLTNGAAIAVKTPESAPGNGAAAGAPPQAANAGPAGSPASP
jgi:multidrug efflux system membrane fusion protein